MTGPIAAAMAALISAAAVIGNADCSDIMAEADARAALEQEKEKASQYLIAIDPGHQGHGNFEQEAIGPGASETKNKVAGGTSGVSTGVAEYELTLDIGLQLRDELEARGYTVIMTRETNEVDISNSERAAVANEADADAFIRIHANGSDNHGAAGAMTICQTPGNIYNGDLYEDSRALSDCVLNAYTAATGIDYEYVWETDTMSGINWCDVPVTIVEMGYMTNSEEDMQMQDPQFQKKMTDGIADGIDAFMADRTPKEH
jgi:N-acetylmuramoyl-L-alanine amidase